MNGSRKGAKEEGKGHKKLNRKGRNKDAKSYAFSVLLAPASAGVCPDRKRPLPAVRLTPTNKWHDMQDRQEWEGCFGRDEQVLREYYKLA
jgi:hypothetical protein